MRQEIYTQSARGRDIKFQIQIHIPSQSHQVVSSLHPRDWQPVNLSIYADGPNPRELAVHVSHTMQHFRSSADVSQQALGLSTSNAGERAGLAVRNLAPA